MELKLIPFMTMQSFWLKALGTIIVLVSVMLHIDGKMDLLTTIIMIISSYLIYAQLDNAGKYSALLRTVDASVKQAQEILATPQMDISGRDIQPEHFDISAENIGFSYDQRKIIDFEDPGAYYHCHCRTFRRRKNYAYVAPFTFLGCGRGQSYA